MCSFDSSSLKKSTQNSVIIVIVLLAILKTMNISWAKSHTHNNSGQQDTDKSLEIKLYDVNQLII